MADKPKTPIAANGEKPLRKWLLWCGAVTATIATGAAVRPVVEFVATMDLRKEVADLKLKQFSDTELIKSELKSINDKLDGRDAEIIALALEAYDRKHKEELVRNPQ